MDQEYLKVNGIILNTYTQNQKTPEISSVHNEEGMLEKRNPHGVCYRKKKERGKN